MKSNHLSENVCY